MAYVIFMIALFVCAPTGDYVGANPFTATNHKRWERSSTPPNQQAQAAQRQTEDVRGTQQSPAVVRVLPIPKTPEETTQEQGDRERQATTNRRLVWLTGTIALFTLGLIVVGVLQWKTYQATLATNKDIERAYVTMSHTKNGVTISEWKSDSATLGQESPGTHELKITVEVKNYGNTPARITYVLLHPHFDDMAAPEEPPYDRKHGDGGQAFLVKGDSVFLRRSFDIPHAEFERLHSAGRNSLRKMWIIGYIDYIDVFGQRHRAGYGRVYDPVVDHRDVYEDDRGAFDEHAFKSRNNLPLETSPNYNYDRKRKKKDDGHDWPETG